MLNVPILTAAL